MFSLLVENLIAVYLECKAINALRSFLQLIFQAHEQPFLWIGFDEAIAVKFKKLKLDSFFYESMV